MVRLILIATLVLIVLIAAKCYLNYRSSTALIESISTGEGVSSVLFSPSFPSSFAQISGPGILVVSTGKISNFKFVDEKSGKTIGKASILDAVTKNSAGKLKKIPFILQLSSTTDSQRNLIPWITAKASQLRKLPAPESGQYLTNSQLSQIFIKGSKWIFIPVLDLESAEIWESLPEYHFYVRSYYGEKLAEFRSFVENGLSGSWKRSVPLQDVFYLFQ